MPVATDAEAGFWAAIEASPAESTHYLVFADWLAERDDPRDQAFRVLGKWGLSPWYFSGSGCWGWWLLGSWHPMSPTTSRSLPEDWLQAVPLSRHILRGGTFRGRFDNVHAPEQKPGYGVRVLLKATATGFLSLPHERRAELLEKGPTYPGA